MPFKNAWTYIEIFCAFVPVCLQYVLLGGKRHCDALFKLKEGEFGAVVISQLTVFNKNADFRILKWRTKVQLTLEHHDEQWSGTISMLAKVLYCEKISATVDVFLKLKFEVLISTFLMWAVLETEIVWECFQTEMNRADHRLLKDKLVAPQKYEKCVNTNFSFYLFQANSACIFTLNLF